MTARIILKKRGERDSWLARRSARKLQSCGAAKLITSLSLRARRALRKKMENSYAPWSLIWYARARERGLFCGRSTYITALFPLPAAAAIVNILNKNIRGSLPVVMSIKYNQVRQSPFCVLCVAQCHCLVKFARCQSYMLINYKIGANALRRSR